MESIRPGVSFRGSYFGQDWYIMIHLGSMVFTRNTMETNSSFLKIGLFSPPKKMELWFYWGFPQTKTSSPPPQRSHRWHLDRSIGIIWISPFHWAESVKPWQTKIVGFLRVPGWHQGEGVAPWGTIRIPFGKMKGNLRKHLGNILGNPLPLDPPLNNPI